MNLESQLARELVHGHPDRAAAVLERLPAVAVVPLLAAVPPADGAALLGCLPPQDGAALLEASTEERAARLLDALPLDTASRIARRIGAERRSTVFARLSPETAGTLRTLLAFPENTAGALMDPSVLALPGDLTVREARRRVREASRYAQYNLYVVDREQRLAGVLNLRELLRARPRATLADVMVRDPARLEAHADRAAILGHPLWRDVRALPVVDERGGYLGAIRYHVVRELEEELLGKGVPEVPTAEALGELFAAGAAGVFEALTAPGGDRADREEE